MTSGGAVRRYTPADRDELLTLFARAGDGSPTGTLWRHTPSEAAIYLTPYLDHEPGSVFVAIADGALVGYLAGSLGSGAVPSEEDRMVRAISRYLVVLRPRSMPFFARSIVDGVRDKRAGEPAAGEIEDARWPAHLHVNVAPEARGTGLAQGLMAAFQEHVRDSGVPGAYLQTLVENERAATFFARSGFVPYGEAPAVPGLRLADGGRAHQLTMVWPAPDQD
ncbi:GNAT family N-acetyltransferase [Krasilnikoviella flava]|uniref:Acetyltransferase (GNAT) family protein n=1 Tax=Krasilnikoviella flava TaxID=526729 RepID=A0A1T5ILQ0_9MICO|nr:GNAT family N-acetyltransferase [Krasilnikoviella flava]SKC39893.1 Acetyltransferase (GNAT) family protein [Krasilnikoviella flava]